MDSTYQEFFFGEAGITPGKLWDFFDQFIILLLMKKWINDTY